MSSADLKEKDNIINKKKYFYEAAKVKPQSSDGRYLDERHCSVGVVDGLHHGLRGHQVSDALRGGQVVLRGGGRGHLLVLESVQQILAAVLLVAVLDDGPQRLRPGHLWDASVHVNMTDG